MTLYKFVTGEYVITVSYGVLGETKVGIMELSDIFGQIVVGIFGLIFVKIFRAISHPNIFLKCTTMTLNTPITIEPLARKLKK